MNTSEKSRKSEAYYTPEPVLKEIICDLLQVQAKRTEMKKKKEDDVIEITQKEKDDFSKLQSRTNRKKNHVLRKYVFQSLANLTFLLEEMQKKPYIRKRFEDDVKVLFFAESSKSQDPMFLRFLIACVLKHKRGKASSTDEIQDFRYVLAEYMQRAVMILMQEIGPHKQNMDRLIVDMVNGEVGQAFKWVKVFAQQPARDLQSDKKKRRGLYEQRRASF